MDKAHKQTDERLAKMEKHLSGIYSKAQKGIGKAWTDYLIESTKEIDSLQVEYDRAKKSGDRDEMRKIARKLNAAKKERTLRDKHFKNLSKNLAAELANVNKTALAYVNGQLPEIYALNINEVNEGIANAVKGYSFELVNADVVKQLAESEESLLPYKELDENKDIRWNTRKINSEVLQGIIQGESMTEIAGRMVNVVGMNETAAIRNARTMVTGAECRGRMEGFRKAEESGIILKKRWIATHDGRTRDWHSELNGAEVDTDEPFVNSFGEIMYPGDPSAHPANVYNCRCTIASRVVGFKKVSK